MKRTTVLRGLAGTALGALACGTAVAADLPALKAGALPVDTDSVIFMAQSEGYFRKTGLDVNVQPMNTGATVAAAILSGDLDFGSMNTMSLALARQNGATVKVIAPGSAYSYKAPTTQLLVPKDSPLQSARDLNGKTIAVNALKGVAHISAIAWVDKHGGDAKSVKFIEIPFSTMPVALTSRRVDGAIVAEPQLSAARANCRVLGNTYDGFANNWIITMYVSSEAWIKAHPEAIGQIRSAIVSTAKWANRHHAETAPLLAKIAKMDAAEVSSTSRAIFGESLDRRLIQPVLDVAFEYGVLTGRMSADDMIA